MAVVGETGHAGPGAPRTGAARHDRRGARLHRTAAVLVTGLLLGTGLAACSSSSSSSGSSSDATAIAARSKQTMSGLTSFRVTGNITSSNQTTTVNLVLATTVSGGTISTGQGSFQVISDGTHVYLSATEPFWTSQGVPAATAQTLADKWVTGFPAAESKSLTKSLDAKQLLGPLYTGGVTSSGTTTVAGQKAYTLKASDGSTAYIAATGPPYLLEVQSPNNGAQGKVVFSEFGTAATPTLPTGAIDLSTVAG